MTIVNSFYYLFKSNSSELKKGVQESKKAVDELGTAAKKTNEQTEALGESFVKMVEGATQAAAAYVSFSAIKSGIFNESKVNSNLQIQSKLLGQNVSLLKAYGAAGAALGGSSTGIVDYFSNLQSQYAASGISIKNIDQLIVNQRNQFKQLRTLTEQQMFYQKMGITDVGHKSLLSMSDTDFQNFIDKQKELAVVTIEDAEAARKFEQELSNTQSTIGSLFTKLGTNLLPAMTSFNAELQEVNKYIGNSPRLIDTMTSAVIALGAALGTVALYAARAAGPLAAVIGVSAILPNAASAGGDWIGRQYNKYKGRGDADGRLGGGKRGAMKPVNGQSSYDFWLSQGYSSSQASVLAATEHHESSGNPAAIGDGGRARGIFQWHPDRQAAIFAGTGIDVTTAGIDDQRRAAAWELKNSRRYGWSDDKFRSMSDTGDASAYLTSKFITPADISGQSIARAQTALQIANSTPVTLGGGASGGNAVSVTTGNITINSQATDASGISRDIVTELNKQISSGFANIDNGIAR